MIALERRRADLDRLGSETFDVLVVGGGITGAGCLLEATERGLRAALVEADDLAVGSSSRSSKLIHGGLRYLEQFRFRLVHEALRERRALLRLAPHLVRLERFLVPVHGSPLGLGYIGAGLALYDQLGARADGGRTRLLRPRSAVALAPALRRERLRGAFVYHDAVEDDARLVVAAVRTAARAGAVALTRVRALELEPDRRATRVRVRDALGGEELVVRARTVIDATGAGPGIAASGNPSATLPPDAADLRPSRGIHLVVPRDRIASEVGLTIRVPGRVVFVIPWGASWIVGTTDVPHAGPVERPAATRDELDYLLANLHAVVESNVDEGDVVATYAGIRPLATGGSGPTAQLSREHRVTRTGGAVTIRGGKYTTFRVMARDAVDAAVPGTRRPAVGDGRPFAGALDAAGRADVVDELTRRPGLEPALVAHLVDRHGSDAAAVADLGTGLGLLRPLLPEHPYLEAEVAWAVREERALSLDDVLARRLRLAIEAPNGGAAAARRAAQIVGAELGWSAEREAAEVAAYRVSAAGEYGLPAPSAASAVPGDTLPSEVAA